MLGGSELSSVSIIPSFPQVAVKTERSRSNATAPTSKPKTPSEALERDPSEPVSDAEFESEIPEDFPERRPSPVLPRVLYRAVGSLDEAGPLSEVDGIPIAVRTPALFPNDSPLKSKSIEAYERPSLGGKERVGLRVDRRA